MRARGLARAPATPVELEANPTGRITDGCGDPILPSSLVDTGIL